MEHMKDVLLFAAIMAVAVRCEVPDQNQTASTVLKAILDRMDSIIRPNLDIGPVEVKCGFYVVSFGSISEVDMDYSMDIYMRQTWQDSRMAFTNGNITMLTLSGKAIEKIWTPDLFFPNEKSADFHVVTVPNKLMKVYADGTVVYSVRITLKLSCPMDLTHFPMDQQECFIKIESYSYSTSEMALHWFDEDAIEIDEELELPQFDLKGYDMLQCSMAYKTGEYPCLKARFRLERQYGFYMLQTYVPSILIVILSWVSFWINMEAVPARISLGVTTVLTMATQMSGSKSAIPRVSYPKAIDIWLSTCMFFVFAALLEYAIVNALSRKHTKIVKRRETMRQRSGKSQIPDETELEMDGKKPLMKPRQWLKSTEKARILDKASRLLFPISFVVFNIVYWIVYLNPTLTD